MSLIAAVSGQEQDALQAIIDGVTQGNLPLAIIGGVVLVALVLLMIFKKDLPFVGPVVDAALTVARSIKPKAKPSDQAGAAAVVPVKTLDQTDEKK